VWGLDGAAQHEDSHPLKKTPQPGLFFTNRHIRRQPLGFEIRLQSSKLVVFGHRRIGASHRKLLAFNGLSLVADVLCPIVPGAKEVPMNGSKIQKVPYRTLRFVCAILLAFLPAGSILLGQAPPPEAPPAQAPQAPAAQTVSPEQLDNLVAPIALYPDSLLSQVLVGATYPLEVAEASQWLQQNRNLQGQALVDAARQQNWDPSIQALVVFPDVLNRMASNIRWTTDLGNAFLAQQADVMNAVQRMRAQAQAAGRLSSNPQETVTDQTQDGRTVIEIAPANPEVVYVPTYDPAYIWGPPAWGYYPPLYYPAFGFGFGSGIYIGAFFGGLGWGGWGWGPNWFACNVFERPFFFNHYGFHDFGGYRGYGGFGGGFRGGNVWAHNPEHRLGVPYSNASVAGRFGGATAGTGRFAAPNRSSLAGFNNGASRSFNNGASRGFSAPSAGAGGWRRFGEPGSGAGTAPQRGSAFAGRQNSYAPSVNRGGNSWSRFGTPSPAYRSGPSYGGGANRSMPSYRSTPSFSGGGAYRSAPSSGGGGAYRAAPSFGGGGGGFRSAPSFGGGGGFRGSSGGGFHGGGGGFHGGGGGHGGGRR
jgi:hypothetical protein